MFIKNLSSEDFILNIHGASIKIPKNVVSYLDEEIISSDEIQRIYGKYIAVLPSATGVTEDYIDLKQTKLEANKVYAVLDHMAGLAQVSDNTGADIYMSDKTTEPASASDMVKVFATLNDIKAIEILPKYILSTKSTTIVTNLKLKKLS